MKNFNKIFFIAICLFVNTIFSQCYRTVSAGFFFSTGIKSNNTLWGWGNNDFGQLGDGMLQNHLMANEISNNSWMTSSCGDSFMIAIKSDGTIWGCGDNSINQLGLGNGSASYLTTLTQLNTATTWKQITASDSFTIGLKTNGTIWGWGANDTNEMGQNTCCADQKIPLQIGTATDWKEVAATRSNNAFAIKTNGTLWAWGLNSGALLGDSSVSQWGSPTQHNNSTNWDKLFPGHGHMLALKTDGTLWAWGGGGSGETTQDPNNILFPAVPLQIAGTWKTAAAGFGFSMGIKTDGTLWAWGLDDVGQLGDGGTTNRHIPYQLGTATNWDSVSCGYQFTVALRTDGSLWSWGVNDFGQLGNGSITNATAPTQVPVTGCALGTAAFSANETIFILSPNPATNELSLHYKGTENVDTITIYDLRGRALQTLLALGNANFKTTFQVSQLASGSYILELKNKNKIVATRKFLKE